MMDEEAAFLKAISDNPADETSRSVYADWLADRDDLRAAFARLSAEFLRCVRGLAEVRKPLPKDWAEAVDPLFGRIRLFELPLLGEAVEEGRVAALRVEPGTTLSPGDIVLEFETDKALMDVPTEHAGLVLALLVRAGQQLRVGAPLLVYLTLQFERPAVPPAWQLPGGPPFVKPEPMLDWIARLDKLGDIWDSVAHAVEYLDRYREGAEIVFGYTPTNDAINQSYFGAGWHLGVPKYLIETMRNRGMTDKQICRELVSRHVQAFRMLLSRYGQPTRFTEWPGCNPPVAE